MSDLISRQEAIDAICTEGTRLERNGTVAMAEIKQWCVDILDALPSAQPKIIRCRDCKHWDGVDTCDVIDAPVWDNDFCSMAERRSDE